MADKHRSDPEHTQGGNLVARAFKSRASTTFPFISPSCVFAQCFSENLLNEQCRSSKYQGITVSLALSLVVAA